MELPPRDPHEPDDPEPVPIATPTVVFSGKPNDGDERLADAILQARPGVLFVARELG